MLADSAYWLAHHDATGELRTSARSAAAIVTAAAFGELVLDGSISVRDGIVVACALPHDPLGLSVVQQISAEPAHYPLSEWLEHLACGMRRRIRMRMVTAGRAEPRRVGFLRPPLIVARADDPWPGSVHSGLARAISHDEPLDGTQRFLLRLAQHTSLSRGLFRGAPPDRAESAVDQTTDLWPPWQTVLETAIRTPALRPCPCTHTQRRP